MRWGRGAAAALQPLLGLAPAAQLSRARRVAAGGEQPPVRSLVVGKFAGRALGDGEEVLAETRPHALVLLGPALLLAAALAGAVAIAVELPQAPVAVAWLLTAMVAVPALWLGVRFLRWRATRLLVTPTRLVYRRGVLSRDVVRLRLHRVTEVHCTQRMLDRLVGRGRLVLELSGDDPVVIEDVRRPRSLQRLVDGCLDDLAGSPRRGATTGGPPSRGSSPATRTSPRSSSRRAPARDGAGAGWSDTPPHGAAADRSPAPGSLSATLVELDGLRRRGILSAEEFAAKKAELLRRW